MRYASIRDIDISNGEGVGVALFVQGCNFRCYNCFNSDTWDFGGGKEWNNDIESRFLSLVSRPHIKRVSILGGEPLADENLQCVYDLITKIRLSFSSKSIWLYTGYTLEQCQKDEIRYATISQCDIVVDGKYIDSQKDFRLRWKGSANQRVIDIQKTIQKGVVVEKY